MGNCSSMAGIAGKMVVVPYNRSEHYRNSTFAPRSDHSYTSHRCRFQSVLRTSTYSFSRSDLTSKGCRL